MPRLVYRSPHTNGQEHRRRDDVSDMSDNSDDDAAGKNDHQ